MSSLKSRMAALKKGMGIGSTDVKGTKLPHTAAATNAASIQLRLALIIQVSKLSLLFAARCACALNACLDCSAAELLTAINRNV